MLIVDGFLQNQAMYIPSSIQSINPSSLTMLLSAVRRKALGTRCLSPPPLYFNCLPNLQVQGGRTGAARTCGRQYSITKPTLTQEKINVKYARHEEDSSLHFIFSSDDESESESSGSRPRPLILSPCLQMSDEMLHPLPMVGDHDDIVQSMAEEIERHYSLEDNVGGSTGSSSGSSTQFVGGMGENDGGVWFTSSSHQDTLHYCDQIRDVIQQIKQSRHGVPFGVHTSGWVDPTNQNLTLSELGLSSVVVSLLSDNPVGYGDLLKLDDGAEAQRRFGEVCSFLATMSEESGIPMIAAVAGGRHAGGGSDLAKALGAVDVVIYDHVGGRE